MSPREAGEEGGEVIGVVMDMRGRFGRRGDVDGPHAKRVGTARLSSRTSRYRLIKPVLREDGGEGLGIGLGVNSACSTL